MWQGKPYSLLTGLITAVTLLASCEARKPDRPLRGTLGHVRETPIAVLVYDNVLQCVAHGKLSPTACEDAHTSAMSKHPGFAEQFGDRLACDEIYGKGSCAIYRNVAGTFASPRTQGFLICVKSETECTARAGYPVYRNDEWDLFTGSGGGFVTVQADHYATISGVVRRRPVI